MKASALFHRMRSLWLAVAALLLLGGDQPQQAKAPASAGHTVSGPYTYENLTIFLIHGADQLKNRNFLTLKEALERKIVIVHETSQVNQLSIENISKTEEVFVLSGDIVKGGKQDRIIAYDLIVPPISGKIPLASFCVENGRWQRRGTEDVKQFGSSTANSVSKDLKIAVRQEMNQAKVWENVAKSQVQIGYNLGKSVRNSQSATSLQLTLEDKDLQQLTEKYMKQFSTLLDRKDDVIGFAFAINGKVNSADVYATHGLFEKLWPTLLKSTCIEAIAELKKGSKFNTLTVDEIKAFLADAEKGKASEKQVTTRVRIIQRETEKNYLFETRDPASKAPALRSNYIAK